MKVQCRVGLREVRAALSSAEALNARELGNQLNAPVDAAFMGRVDDIWERIKETLIDSVRRGQDEVNLLVESTWQFVSERLTQAGAKARLIEECLLERMRAYVGALHKSLLAQVLPAVSIGNLSLALDAISLSQSIRVDCSLKSSLTELIALSSNGAIEVTASYRAEER